MQISTKPVETSGEASYDVTSYNVQFDDEGKAQWASFSIAKKIEVDGKVKTVESRGIQLDSQELLGQAFALPDAVKAAISAKLDF